MAKCFCCLTTSEKVDIAIKSYGKVHSLAEIDVDSKFPQLVMGRIIPVGKVLETPILHKPCVYYNARVEELVDRNDQNALSGEVDGDKVWTFLCGETVGVDFALTDPSIPNSELYIPGTQVSIKVHATQDILNARSKGVSAAGGKKLSPEIKKFLEKLKVHYTDKNGNSQKILRFKESSFEFGEQIAVLGIVKEVMDENNISRKVLLPVTNELFTDEFAKAKGFSDWDIRSWRDLTETPCIILTDMPKYFQDISIKKIFPNSVSKQLPLDVNSILNGSSVADTLDEDIVLLHNKLEVMDR